MNRIFLAASALSMFVAAPAFAAVVGPVTPAPTQTVQVQGTVAAQCGKGNQSGGGTGGGETVDFGNLVDANGQLVAQSKEITFGNLWCNSKSNYSVDVSDLKTGAAVTDTGSFTNTLDLTLSGAIVNTYFGGGSVSTGAPKTGTIAGAFETGTGQYSKGLIAVSLPAGTAGNDRPVAGTYKGKVTVTLTPAA